MIDTYLLIVCRLNYPHSIWNHVHSFWLLSPFWMMYEAKNCVIQMFRCTFCNLLIFSIFPLHNFVNCCNWMILLSTFFSEMLLKSVGTIHFICVGSECEIECCFFFFLFRLHSLFVTHNAMQWKIDEFIDDEKAAATNEKNTKTTTIKCTQHTFCL